MLPLKTDIEFLTDITLSDINVLGGQLGSDIKSDLIQIKDNYIEKIPDLKLETLNYTYKSGRELNFFEKANLKLKTIKSLDELSKNPSDFSRPTKNSIKPSAKQPNFSYTRTTSGRVTKKNTQITNYKGLSEEDRKKLDFWFWESQRDKKAILALYNDNHQESVKYIEFIITSVSQQDQESISVFDGFGISVIQSFGSTLPIYSFNISFPHNKLKPWYGNFMSMWDNILRASQLIGKGYKAILYIGDDSFDIIPFSFNRGQTYNNKYLVSGSFSAFVSSRNIFHNDDQYANLKSGDKKYITNKSAPTASHTSVENVNNSEGVSGSSGGTGFFSGGSGGGILNGSTVEVSSKDDHSIFGFITEPASQYLNDNFNLSSYGEAAYDYGKNYLNSLDFYFKHHGPENPQPSYTGDAPPEKYIPQNTSYKTQAEVEQIYQQINEENLNYVKNNTNEHFGQNSNWNSSVKYGNSFQTLENTRGI